MGLWHTGAMVEMLDKGMNSTTCTSWESSFVGWVRQWFWDSVKKHMLNIICEPMRLHTFPKPWYIRCHKKGLYACPRVNGDNHNASVMGPQSSRTIQFSSYLNRDSRTTWIDLSQRFSFLKVDYVKSMQVCGNNTLHNSTLANKYLDPLSKFFYKLIMKYTYV